MKKVLLTVVVILLIGWPDQVRASSGSLLNEQQLQSTGFSGYEVINPNSLLYQFKRAGEVIKTKLSANKNDYQKELLESRFKELVYIINSQKTNFLPETVEHYNSLAGQLKSDAVDVKSKSLNRLKILEKLRDQYPANSAYWMSIQQAIDVTRSLD